MRAIIRPRERIFLKRSKLWGGLMRRTREGTPKEKREKKKRGDFSSCLWRRWRANVAVLCVFCFGSANATAIAPSTLMVRRASVQHNKWISNSNSGTIVVVVVVIPVVISSDARRERRPTFTAADRPAQTGSEARLVIAADIPVNGGARDPIVACQCDSSNRGGATLRRPRRASRNGKGNVKEMPARETLGTPSGRRKGGRKEEGRKTTRVARDNSTVNCQRAPIGDPKMQRCDSHRGAQDSQAD